MRRLACAALLILSACATAPPVPSVPSLHDASGAGVAIDDDERRLWERAKEERTELAEKDLLVNDQALNAYLQAVLNGLMPTPLPEPIPKPAVYVTRSSARIGGAFADGGIWVTVAMLAAIENEAQLAALLGHELGHFTARHQLIAARFAATNGSLVDRMELSRQQESAADQYALMAMRQAGYDPREAMKLLALAGAEEEEWSPGTEVFRSHPFTAERIRDLNAAIAAGHDQALRVDAERYNQAIASVLPLAAEVELKAGQLDRANASIARLLALQPQNGRAYYLKAEHARLTERDGRNSAPARQAYQRAVELAPNDPEVVRALGLLYQGDGNIAAATPLLEKYLQLAPDAADRKLIERYLGRRQ